MAASVAVRPHVSTDDAISIARDVFLVEGTVAFELGSNQDRNFLIKGPEGSFVLKFANRAWDRDALQAQNAALAFISTAFATDTLNAFSVPKIRLSRLGQEIVDSFPSSEPGYPICVRMLTFLPGQPLSRAPYLAPRSVAALGRLAGAVSAALRTFEHPGLDAGPSQWNLEHGESVVQSLLSSIPDARNRTRVAALAASAGARLRRVSPQLRRQAVHGDITDDNVTCEPDAAGRLIPCGAIDFGDLCRSWAVAELAVCLTGVLRH